MDPTVGEGSLAMKQEVTALTFNVFGTMDMTWRGQLSGDEHVIVATRGSAWTFLCRALPSEYETVDPKPQPTAVPTVWKHDRAKVTCPGCIAVLDGATVQRTEPRYDR